MRFKDAHVARSSKKKIGYVPEDSLNMVSNKRFPPKDKPKEKKTTYRVEAAPKVAKVKSEAQLDDEPVDHRDNDSATRL